MWLHSFGLIYIKWFASSTYGFSFRINEFEWNKFDVREFVSFLIKVLRYCIGGLVLYGRLRCSPNLSRSARFVCPMYSARSSAGAFEVFLHFRHFGSCRWGFWMHKWLFAWYDVLGLCFWMYMMTDRLEWRSRFCISLSYISWFLAGVFVSVYFLLLLLRGNRGGCVGVCMRWTVFQKKTSLQRFEDWSMGKCLENAKTLKEKRLQGKTNLAWDQQS